MNFIETTTVVRISIFMILFKLFKTFILLAHGEQASLFGIVISELDEIA